MSGVTSGDTHTLRSSCFPLPDLHSVGKEQGRRTVRFLPAHDLVPWWPKKSPAGYELPSDVMKNQVFLPWDTSPPRGEEFVHLGRCLHPNLTSWLHPSRCCTENMRVSWGAGRSREGRKRMFLEHDFIPIWPSLTGACSSAPFWKFPFLLPSECYL